VHRKEGTQRARHTKEPVLIAGRGEIKPPRSLGADEKRVFLELLGLFEESNLLDMADVYAIEGCARALCRARAAARDVRRRGLLTRGRFGQMVENPSFKQEREAWAAFRAFAAQLGLSPSDRARLAGAGVKGREPEAEIEGLAQVRQLRAVK
jgi:P27 family predicted phage terminase small subunit